MKKQMSIHLGFCLSLLVAFTFLLSSCSQTAKTSDSDSASVSNKSAQITNKPGFYEDRDIGFSLTWPADVFTVQGKMGKGEVVRVVHAMQVPVLTLAVIDVEKGKAVPLAESGNQMKASLKSIPGSKRHKVIESSAFTMKNGVEAGYSVVKWRAGNFGLLTYFVTAYRGDKQITVSCTAAPGQPSAEVMEGWVKALKVNK